MLEGGAGRRQRRVAGGTGSGSRDRVHRDNLEGMAGLADRPLPGRAPRLDTPQMSELVMIVEKGPEADGVVRGGRIDLCRVVEQRFGVRVTERTIGAILHRLGFAKLSARPRHSQSDEQSQELYMKTSPLSCARRCLKRHGASRWSLVPG